MRYTAFFMTFLLYGCSSLKQDKITVTGTAWNAKRGAVVATDRETYTVEGLDSWDAMYYGKKVTVTGRLERVEHQQQSTTDRQVQELVGTELILANPQWELASNKTD